MPKRDDPRGITNSRPSLVDRGTQTVIPGPIESDIRVNEPSIPRMEFGPLRRGQSVLQPRFNTQTLTFLGTPIEQAKYLLRPVSLGGRIGNALSSLPDILSYLLNNTIHPINTFLLRLFLQLSNISESAVGGNIYKPITANYFVIHDTSYFLNNLINRPFPNNINDRSWNLNNLNRKLRKDAHVFVNRLGESKTQNDFANPVVAIKLQHNGILGNISKNVFLHIELIQPRKGKRGYAQEDIEAPYPGFTEAQLKRLALLYIIASSRKGKWLIPTYHAVLDEGIIEYKNGRELSGHDDPQNFDLSLWCKEIEKLLIEINSQIQIFDQAPSEKKKNRDS
jgi:hypothetical protein